MRWRLLSLTGVLVVSVSGVSPLSERLEACGTCIPERQTDAIFVSYKVDDSLGSLGNDIVAAAEEWNTAFANAGSNVRFTRNHTAGQLTVRLDTRLFRRLPRPGQR